MAGAADEPTTRWISARIGPLLEAPPAHRRALRIADTRTEGVPTGGAAVGTGPGETGSLRSVLAAPVLSRSSEVVGGLCCGDPAPNAFTEHDEKILLGVAAQAAALDTARLYRAEQQARAAAEQASRAKDPFIAALSHELRTPLTPVLAILSHLREHEGLPGAARADLETVQRNAELEARLIDDLLDLTRVTQGKLELHRGRISLASLIEDAIATCQPELHAKHLKLVRQFDVAPAGLWLHADGARIMQILWNLLKNAAKFTPEGGTIAVRTSVESRGEQRFARVELSDNGIGIEPEQLDRIFAAFEPGGREITRQFGGLGLGLAISKAIAEAHGGALTAASAGRDQGSTFVLDLPLASEAIGGGGRGAPAAAPAPQLQPAAPASPAPLRILLVEDHEDSATVFTRLLRRAGHEVIHRSSVADALAYANPPGPPPAIDLLISDLGLPDGSGVELLRTLRATRTLPAIALSGYGMEKDLAGSAAAGFVRHLTKPVNPPALLQTIAELFPGPERL